MLPCTNANREAEFEFSICAFSQLATYAAGCVVLDHIPHPFIPGLGASLLGDESYSLGDT